MLINAFENGSRTLAIFIHHPQRNLYEVYYARCVGIVRDRRQGHVRGSKPHEVTKGSRDAMYLREIYPTSLVSRCFLSVLGAMAVSPSSRSNSRLEMS